MTVSTFLVKAVAAFYGLLIINNGRMQWGGGGEGTCRPFFEKLKLSHVTEVVSEKSI